MSLALFDLDETLINGDSDHLWGVYLVENNLINNKDFSFKRDLFKEQYNQGKLNIYEYIEFVSNVLNRLQISSSRKKLEEYRKNFIDQKILPIILNKAVDLINYHKERGDTTIIISATNEFIVRKISEEFNVDYTIATDLEEENGSFTGRPIGIPSFREGKVERTKDFIKGISQLNLEDSYFYSDSLNDIPLLQAVSNPVAVDPDTQLKKHAQENNWKIISLKD